MDSPLTLGLALALVVALLGVAALVVHGRRARSDTRAELVSTRAEAQALRERVESLARRLDRYDAARPDPTTVPDPGAGTGAGAAYVITDAGEDRPGVLAEPRPMVADRVVLNAALGEPLVRAVALGHGLRRALGAESRNRIRFEMRRESKRVRKQRRREMREAYRQARTARATRRPAEDPGARAA